MATLRELYLYIMNTEWAYSYYEDIAREVVKKENANTSSNKHKWKSAQQVRKGILQKLLSKGIIKQDLGKNEAKQLDQMIYNDLMEYVAYVLNILQTTTNYTFRVHLNNKYVKDFSMQSPEGKSVRVVALKSSISHIYNGETKKRRNWNSR